MEKEKRHAHAVAAAKSDDEDEEEEDLLADLKRTHEKANKAKPRKALLLHSFSFSSFFSLSILSFSSSPSVSALCLLPLFAISFPFV